MRARKKTAKPLKPGSEQPISRDLRTLGADYDDGALPKRRVSLGALRGEEREQWLELARECGLAALTTAQTAEEFGISEATLFRWLACDRTFADAYRLNARLADERVEASLYKRAVGYEQVVTKPLGGALVNVIEHVPPDVTAMIFWLKNRQRERWRDVQKHEHEMHTTDGEQVDIRKLAMAIMALAREEGVDPEKLIDGEVVYNDDQSQAAGDADR